MATVKIILKKNKAKSLTQIPLYLRVTKDRKSNYVSLGHKVSEKSWDDDRQRVNAKHPNSSRLNAYLAGRVAEMEDILLEDEHKKQFSSSKKIKETIKGKRSISFTDYAKQFEKSLLRDQNYSRYKKLKGILSKLDEYTESRNLSFGDIDYDFLKNYEEWLRGTKGNRTNTIHTDLKFIRKLFNDGVTEGIVDKEKNPFLLFKLKTEKTSREYLSEEELKRIQELKLTGALDVYRDMFVLASYTGFRISDLLTMKFQNYDGKNITIQMRKTKDTISIKVPTVGRNILDKYVDSNSVKSNYTFPMIPNVKFSTLELQKAIMSKTAICNLGLKQIAALAKIEKTVSFHVSRHTFATLALRKGVRMEYVSALMGHSDLKTTKIYAKIINSELERAMDVFE